MITIHCAWPVLLAYLCLLQVIAALVYLLLSLNMGSPFKDALARYPHLVAIREESARKRKNAFVLGLAVGFVSVLFWRPFSSCSTEAAPPPSAALAAMAARRPPPPPSAALYIR